MAKQAVSLLPAQSKTTGSHHLALGDTTGKAFCKNWQLLALSPEYRLVSLMPLWLEGREWLLEGPRKEINGGLERLWKRWGAG